MNQGMALETLNLAVGWKLPLIVVCIDNGWAITTTSEAVTGGDLVDRARGFGMRAEKVDGTNVAAVYKTSGKLLDRARRGKGPAFLLATCPRLDGHFLGDPLIRMSRQPIAEGKGTFSKVISSAVSRGGGGLRDRAGGMTRMMSVMAKARRGSTRGGKGDPMTIVHKALKKFPEDLRRIDSEVAAEIDGAVAEALAEGGEPSDA
jgi:pyruvate dehydrogenase E1 component alpha subunit